MVIDIANFLCGYATGSILFGPMIVRMAGLPDLHSTGSGNVGATNVLRTGRKDLAILTLLGDAAKGGIVALFLVWLTGDPMAGLVSGVGSILGHNYPLWHGFRGGKGVATSLAVHVVWWPVAGGLGLLVWLAVAAMGRMSSLASLSALAMIPILGWGLSMTNMAQPASDLRLWLMASGVVLVMGIWRHRENIRRILTNKESRISFKKRQ